MKVYQTIPLPCGHDQRYEVHWKEKRSYATVDVWFCIACNYDSVTKKINEGKLPPRDQQILETGKKVTQDDKF